MSFEKVNPSHPDKIADRIAGAMVDLAYKKQEMPKIAVEVLIGHGNCHIIAETSAHFSIDELQPIVNRIANEKNVYVDYREVPQDIHLAENQSRGLKCGDNGIFKGVPTNDEEKQLCDYARALYRKNPTDGKFIFDKMKNELIVCQSNISGDNLYKDTCELWTEPLDGFVMNPLGEWEGGINVDTGATNRKLGSDMGRAITGGGLHGKDLSKADVSVNIVAHILAQIWEETVYANCAIGDDGVIFRSKSHEEGIKFPMIVLRAKKYIDELGGFEKLAEWGLI